MLPVFDLLLVFCLLTIFCSPFYNVEEIDKDNTTSIVRLLQELRGWPILGTAPGGNWNAADFDLMHLLTSHVSSAFFEVGITQGPNILSPIDNRLVVSSNFKTNCFLQHS